MVTPDEFAMALDEYVSAIFMVTVDEMTANTRKREIVNARQIAMYVLRHFTNMSLAQIGQRYNKDHATVMHAIKTVNNISDTDKIYKKVFDNIIVFARGYDIDVPSGRVVIERDYMDEDMLLYSSL